MAHSDALFRHAFEDAPIGMAVLGADGRLERANTALARMLTCEVDDLLGRDGRLLFHPDDAAEAAALVPPPDDRDDSSLQRDIRLQTKRGEPVWARITASRWDDHQAALVWHVEDVTQMRQARDLVARRTQYDHLTGLANRALLLEQLSHVLDRHVGAPDTVACLVIDVDHFKLINDSWGHEAGDIVLVELARRLRAEVRAEDIVARLGGDEFVVALAGIADQRAAQEVLAGLTRAMNRPVLVADHEVVLTVSAGSAFSDLGSTAESLLRNADLAMSAAKNGGRNRVEVFRPNLGDAALVRMSLESELRTAIRDGELVVHYQPIVDLTSRDVVAYEALVRWQHPQRGLLLPRTFIEVCEDTNLIEPLGSFVLHEACRFIAAHPEFTGKVLVNVSTKQIGTADLAGVVRGAVGTAGIAADRLGLEITESGMLLATHAARSDLAALAEMGVHLLIDDFGTGYSALSSVLLNPVTGIKLAREFTLRLGDASTGDRISTAMASLVDGLNMYGVVEGIETEAQYRQARSHGWSLGQGFLFGHPVPAEEAVLVSHLPE